MTGDNAKSKVTAAEVAGEFDAAELVKAPNRAGFHVKVKQRRRALGGSRPD